MAKDNSPSRTGIDAKLQNPFTQIMRQDITRRASSTEEFPLLAATESSKVESPAESTTEILAPANKTLVNGETKTDSLTTPKRLLVPIEFVGDSPNAKPTAKEKGILRQNHLVLFGLCLLLLIVLFLKRSEHFSMPPLAPSLLPSSAPTSSSLNQLLGILKTLPVTSEGTFDDVQSSQYRAALWLADEDRYMAREGLDFANPRFLQRYATAALYFATSGDNWKICGRDSTSCGDGTWLADTDECTWFGLKCEERGKLSQIQFPATGNDLIGTLPVELSLLTGLKGFIAPENALKGDLNLALGALSTLESIQLPDNRLGGTIPIGILQKNPKLELMDLGGNQLTGPIPPAIAVATKLTGLLLSGNLFTGTVPPEIAFLSRLNVLELQANELVGTIPEKLFTLTKLQILSIRQNEGLIGTINPQYPS